MKTVSYAQNLEDILLNRVFLDRCSGFYIDVGAGDPIHESVTKLFYERGWHGINVEPIPAVFEILSSDRPRDINLPIGLSNREGTLVFHEFPGAPAFSTFSRELAEVHHRTGLEVVERSIPVTTLARICEQYDVPTIDFLKIDVESHEREVVEGADWGRFRPRVVVIEATRPNTTIPSHQDWEPLLLAADYRFAFFDGLNRYYVRGEESELLPTLAVPANFFDRFETYEPHFRIQELERQVQRLQQSIDETVMAREHDRAALADTRTLLREMGGQLDRARAELDGARARLVLFEGWGPMTVSVVRMLRRIASRLPMAKPLLRRAIQVRRMLLATTAGGPVPR